MTIKLSDYEKGPDFEGDFDEALRKLQKRLEKIQVAHIVHKRRSVVMLEGWDAAGKGGIIKRMTSLLDPRYFQVWPIAAPTPEELGRHFLWRFWTKLPADKHISIYDRSWYGRVLVERVEGFCSKKEWKRGYDEINEFEAQQVESGTAIVKLFVHITQKEQDKQLAQRLDDPFKRWKTGTEDYRNRARREAYIEAIEDMFAKTDTKLAPWRVVDGNDRKSARIDALTYIADRLEKHVPMDMPDADPAVVELAHQAFGYQPEE
ncbi:MAG: polyphosphate kinase [Alphaproteobacteria bacterium]|nr:polyphosphate kinase [Alphaproteobacteria bacterium]MBU0793220.1 polyphosphate kinase [Alphaproteobacteria bacterium]MBU0877523.1 polyphosphate kinase [Alphaproteobacteria bacterium]MBU1768144.1 polyphosphate kinase [Alphaproteobacteria bacterium]